ncbi:hypothetical protein TNCV_2204301 [Trichonephila clavipes]|nr:hypothetical protein TNCV_2204301 [Trichonephila clavipes]
MNDLSAEDRHLTLRETAAQFEIRTDSPYAILCDHAQNDYEIFPHVSAGEKDKLCLVVAEKLLDTINAELGFLRLLVVPENENTFDRIPFSQKRLDNVESDGGGTFQSIFPEVFSEVEEILD